MSRQMKNILILMITLLFTLGFSRVCLSNQLLVLTENSSTDLTANIGVVTKGPILNPDFWEWTPPFSQDTIQKLTLKTLVFGNTYWVEPESTPTKQLGNWLPSLIDNPISIGIHSDDDFTGLGNPFVPDGTILVGDLIYTLNDGSTITFDIQFIDKGDVAPAVPEPATMLLLGSGLIGLVGYGRKKFFKK